MSLVGKSSHSLKLVHWCRLRLFDELSFESVPFRLLATEITGPAPLQLWANHSLRKLSIYYMQVQSLRSLFWFWTSTRTPRLSASPAFTVTGCLSANQKALFTCVYRWDWQALTGGEKWKIILFPDFCFPSVNYFHRNPRRNFPTWRGRIINQKIN